MTNRDVPAATDEQDSGTDHLLGAITAHGSDHGDCFECHLINRIYEQRAWLAGLRETSGKQQATIERLEGLATEHRGVCVKTQKHMIAQIERLQDAPLARRVAQLANENVKLRAALEKKSDWADLREALEEGADRINVVANNARRVGVENLAKALDEHGDLLRAALGEEKECGCLVWPVTQCHACKAEADADSAALTEREGDGE